MGGINHQKTWMVYCCFANISSVCSISDCLFAVIKVPSKHSGPRLALSQVSRPDPHLCRVSEQMLEGCGSLGLLKQIYPERIYIYIHILCLGLLKSTVCGIAEKSKLSKVIWYTQNPTDLQKLGLLLYIIVWQLGDRFWRG